jgi:Ca2+-binding RTX toxin-like protein
LEPPDFNPEFEGNVAGDDKITGGGGEDYLIDWLGSDTLRGDLGNDLIVGLDDDGTSAPDLLDGGWGKDYIVGDDGDTLVGGGFDDEFNVFLNEDNDAAVTITDFDGEAERLYLSVDEETFAGATEDDLTMEVDPVTGDISVFLLGQKVVHLVDPAGGFSLSNVFLPEWMLQAA